MQSKQLLPLKILLFFALLIWNIGIFSPCFIAKENLFFHHLVKFIYSPVCHQKLERSFTCNYLQFMVCARCMGIYFGAMLAAGFNLLHISVSISKRFLIYSAIPLLADVIMLNLGVYQYNKFLSFVTGNLFGASVFIFIFEILKDYFLEIKKESIF